MKLHLTIAALLMIAAAIPGCATVRSYATCDNARAALDAAKRAADALCPIAPGPVTPSE